MKIALVGATGNIGRQIARHALAKGHQVKAIVRSEKALPAELAGASLAIAPLDDAAALAAVIRGHDVLASAYGPRPGDDIGQIAAVAAQLVAAAREANVPRLVVVGVRAAWRSPRACNWSTRRISRPLTNPSHSPHAMH
ncbi:NAD(P)H-binding protein [Stenotrophomonas sp. 169]|uniref:NAD(P)-dependent oxidoreductase n=1 Tax=Stenotrophomonas sp. 169 TaxID=2770322 RepID=UPI001CB79EC1|nr:NAD(P)H-binding protein [Stenotrophomonas sp. 169]